MRLNEVPRYTDSYFTRARITCAHAGNNRRVVYQVFQRGDAVLCGLKYAMELLGQTGPEVEVQGLADGDRIAPLESVLHLHGPIQELVELETVYLGLLSRMTRVATNVRAVVEAASGKPVLFFPARFDAPEVQEYDGYAAKVGGAMGASTPAGAAAFGAAAVGTMPHALIAAFKGDTVAATLALAEATPDQPIWSLVDFENDSARTAVEVYQALKERGLALAGVRLDTAAALVDQSRRAGGSQAHGRQSGAGRDRAPAPGRSRRQGREDRRQWRLQSREDPRVRARRRPSRRVWRGRECLAGQHAVHFRRGRLSTRAAVSSPAPKSGANTGPIHA